MRGLVAPWSVERVLRISRFVPGICSTYPLSFLLIMSIQASECRHHQQTPSVCMTPPRLSGCRGRDSRCTQSRRSRTHQRRRLGGLKSLTGGSESSRQTHSYGYNSYDTRYVDPAFVTVFTFLTISFELSMFIFIWISMCQCSVLGFAVTHEKLEIMMFWVPLYWILQTPHSSGQSM